MSKIILTTLSKQIQKHTSKDGTVIVAIAVVWKKHHELLNLFPKSELKRGSTNAWTSFFLHIWLCTHHEK